MESTGDNGKGDTQFPVSPIFVWHTNFHLVWLIRKISIFLSFLLQDIKNVANLKKNTNKSDSLIDVTIAGPSERAVVVIAEQENRGVINSAALRVNVRRRIRVEVLKN